MNGFLVTFEGTEGTGKSTQLGLLAEALRARGREVVVTREPGGTHFGASLRGLLLDPAARGLDPLAELFLYLADRSEHLGSVVRPALAGGKVVLCDRFVDATAAYQGYGRGLDLDLIRLANARATRGVRPGLTVLLECRDVATGLARARRRQQEDGSAGVADRFELEATAFHERVRAGYRELAAAEPERFRVFAAEGTPEDLHAQVLAAVLEALERAGAAAGTR